VTNIKQINETVNRMKKQQYTESETNAVYEINHEAVREFIEKLKPNVEKHRTEFNSGVLQFYFEHKGRKLLFQVWPKYTYQVIEEWADGSYMEHTHVDWDDNLNYIGTRDNSLLPKEIDFENLTVEEFLYNIETNKSKITEEEHNNNKPIRIHSTSNKSQMS